MKLVIDQKDTDLLGNNVTVYCRIYQSRFSTEAEFGPYKIHLPEERWPEINQALYYRIEQQLKRLGIVPFEAEFDPVLAHWGSLVEAELDQAEIILDGDEKATLAGLPSSAILQINEGDPLQVEGGIFEFQPTDPGVYKIILWDEEFRPELMKCWFIKATSVEAEKERLRELINTTWAEHFNGGFLFNGSEFDTNAKARENFSYYSTFFAKGGQAPEDFVWTLADDTDLPITQAEFEQLTDALVYWGYALHLTSRDKKKTLDTLTTGAELRAFEPTIKDDWPLNQATTP